MPGLWVFPGGKVEDSDEGDDDLEQARCGAARELQEEAGLSLPAESLLTFSHWLTPVVVKRRFATWFFIAEVGSNEPVTVDGSEIVAHEWWRPGTRFALTTRVSSHYAADAGVAARSAGEDDPSCCLRSWVSGSAAFFPRVVRDGDQMVFLYEGDAAYESGDLTQQGAQHRTLGAQGIFRYVGAD